ncbi:glycosyltransferase family 92 protein [bacterium]|nr:glycosyltransferase family 92 protein [bacterium]
MKCYTECYQQYHKKYDWIAFFDIDEFLHIDNNLSIKQFLSQ